MAQGSGIFGGVTPSCHQSGDRLIVADLELLGREEVHRLVKLWDENSLALARVCSRQLSRRCPSWSTALMQPKDQEGRGKGKKRAQPTQYRRRYEVALAVRIPVPHGHGSVRSGSDNHGSGKQSFFLEWSQRDWDSTERNRGAAWTPSFVGGNAELGYLNHDLGAGGYTVDDPDISTDD